VSHASELYQELILDHGRRPRNLRALEGATHRADGHNPLCGDRVTVFVLVEGGVVKDVSFQGAGCAISQASSSIMTEAVRGRTLAEVEALFGRFHDLVTGQAREPGEEAEGLGKLEAFAGVAEFPMRVKCATLSWHTLRAALAGGGQPVSTE
jgi:nitrogen fixation NifU-like protein